MNLTIVFLIFDRDAFFGSSASTRLDTFGDLGRFERIVQHQQRIVVAVRSAVATAGVFREIGSLRRQRDGSETFAGRRQVLVVDSDEIALIRDCALILFMM